MVPIHGHIAANKRRTLLLIFLFALLFALFGFVLGAFAEVPELGLIIAALVFIVVILISYFGGKGIVTAMAGARPAAREREPYLYQTVEALSIAAGRPVPEIYIIETDVPNAFALGRNPDHAAITVTRGLMNRLDRLELEGVLAHEMAHINNYDVLLATVAVVLAGTIIYVSYFVRRTLWYSGGRRSRRSNSSGYGQLIAFLLILLVSILAPLFAQLLKFAISRQREFLADATAAEFTGYPEGLASALEKISQTQAADSPINNPALQGLYIVNPALGARGANWASTLFSTHPTTGERVKRLRSM